MLRGIVRLITALLSATSALLLLIAPVLAVESDTVADAALGQPDLVSNECNRGGISARSLCGPMAVAMDPSSGHLFVADTGNNRVLRFSNARRFASGEAADLVLGQPDFTTAGGPCAAASRQTFCSPLALAVDAAGRLYIADSVNGRVLRFDAPSTNFQPADLVLGQADFTATSAILQAGAGGVVCQSQGNLCEPTALALDHTGRLYVADRFVGVIRWNQPTASGQPADVQVPGGGPPAADCAHFACALVFRTCEAIVCSPSGLAVSPGNDLYVADDFFQRILRIPPDRAPDLVLGQPDFGVPSGGFGAPCTDPPTAASLCGPSGLSVDRGGHLFVADTGNNRVLGFGVPSVNGQPAQLVVGQSTFTARACNAAGVNASSLCAPSDVAVDFRADLFVAEILNNRVVRFDQLSNGTQPPTGTRSVGIP